MRNEWMNEEPLGQIKITREKKGQQLPKSAANYKPVIQLLVSIYLNNWHLGMQNHVKNCLATTKKRRIRDPPTTPTIIVVENPSTCPSSTVETISLIGGILVLICSMICARNYKIIEQQSEGYLRRDKYIQIWLNKRSEALSLVAKTKEKPD